MKEELEEALGAAPSACVGANRTGYRHGKCARTLSTSLGATTIMMPRAQIDDADGRHREWRSTIIPRYQRRTERVDEAILGVYLSGTNTRRLRGALSPLLRGAPLSKDACRVWSGDCAKTLPRGPGATSASSKSATCFSMAGIRGCGSGKSACGCRRWSPWGVRRRAPGDFGSPAGGSGKRARLA